MYLSSCQNEFFTNKIQKFHENTSLLQYSCSLLMYFAQLLCLDNLWSGAAGSSLM